MDKDLRDRIDQEVKSNSVVLFMKGSPTAPRCGFSATVAGILDELVGDYRSVDVLSDPELREGIKEYSEWPTIPQVYIKGEFVGGCDLVQQMYESGELAESLGLELSRMEPPRLAVTPAAAAALKQALEEVRKEEGDDSAPAIRIEISGDYQHGLSVGTLQARDVAVDVEGVSFVLDRGSARRAEGLVVDYVHDESGAAFKIENPNEPPRVKSVSVQALKQAMEKDPELELFDVRSQKERDTAQIAGSKLLDREMQQYIMNLDRETPLYFHCHHGARSHQAAAFFLSHGFTNVFNVEGGIDAWSQEIDSDVPRY